MRLQLIVETGALIGSRFTIETGKISIGRSPDCTVRFPDTATGVSNLHAEILSTPEGFTLIDHKSTNGTYLNRTQVHQAILHTGDVIQLGRRGPTIRVQLDNLQMQPPPIPPPIPPSQSPALNRIQNLGFYDPDRDTESHPGRTILLLGLTGVMGLLVMLILLGSLGWQGAFIGTFMAFSPAPFYLLVFLWIDRFDPEPLWALALAFAWGGLFSIIVSFIINTLFGSIVTAFIGKPAGLTLSAIVSAPLIEETSKGLGVLLIFLFLRKEFDGILDGIVYAGIVGLGFATVENVMYYGGAFLESGVGSLPAIAFLRGVLSPFIHSLFTAMTGIGCGIARESHQPGVRITLPILGWGLAVLLHSMWNLCASLMEGMFFVAYFVVWVPLFLIFLGAIWFTGRREKRIVGSHLALEEGGLLTKAELDVAASTWKRIRWLLSSGNLQQYSARRRFLRAVTKLGFCYWHMERAMTARTETISLHQVPKLRQIISRLKPEV